MKRKNFAVSPKSWVGLDITKFLCVVGMILLHSLVWLISRDDVVIESDNFLFPLLPWIFTIIGPLPLLIPATAGCMMFVYLHPHLKAKKEYPLRSALLSGIGLILFGYLLNLLAWGLDDVWAWDVLHFLGISFVLIMVIMRVASFLGIFIVGGGSLVLTQVARDNLSEISYLGPILVGDSSGMFFWPFFPWFSLVVVGFVMAAYYFSPSPSKIPLVFLLLIGIMLMIPPLFTGDIPVEVDEDNIWGTSVFQPPTSIMTSFLGMFIILIIITEYVGRKIKLRAFGFVNSLSKGILWVYAFHLIVGFRLSHYMVKWLSLEKSLVLFPVVLLLLSWCVGMAAVWIGKKKFIVEVRRNADGE